MAIVYKITNIANNKPYIGWTKKPLLVRWNEHKKSAIKHVGNRKFYNAIKKHGVDVWNIEILEENLECNFAKQKEIEYIKFFNSYNTGYNSTLGGDGNNGIVMSEESNKKRSIALTGIPKNYNRFHNKTHTDATKLQISRSHMGMKKPWVKWSKEQIVKRAMTRRALNREQYDEIHKMRSLGYTHSVISIQLGLTLDIVKKWSKKNWEF